MDQIDKALLAHLQRDARQTNRDLAAAAHVVPSTSLQRVRGMVAGGVITGFHAAVDLGKIGRAAQALISVRIRPPSRRAIEGFRAWASARPEIIGIFITSGSHDFILHVAVPSTDNLYTFVIDHLTTRTEVADVNTSIVYEHIRSQVITPTN